MSETQTIKTIIIISANTEWRVVRGHFPNVDVQTSPLGEWFTTEFAVENQQEPVVFFHGGWGKIAAAASTQYVIDRWSPTLLINLGTCGGFAGSIAKGTIILVERTIIYDIIEMMTDSIAAIDAYSTTIDLSWLGDSYPHDVQRGLLVSADRDLQVEDIPHLKATYGAVAGDWESGAIAYIAARNHTRCLILRGVSDLVGTTGEAYGSIDIFIAGTERVFQELMQYLPQWIAKSVGTSFSASSSD